MTNPVSASRDIQGAVPFLGPATEARWRAWKSAPLGLSGATIVEAEMSDWSGHVPSTMETVVHALMPGSSPLDAKRDLGDGRSDTLVREGQICVTPAARPGHWAWRGDFRDLNLVLPRSLLARTADDAGFADVPDLMPVAREPIEDRLVEGMVRWMGGVGRGEVQPSAAEADHAVAFVALWLLRQAEPTLRPPRGGLSALAVRRVRAHVEANLDRDLAVGALADLVGLSTPYFSHAFRKSVGEAPHRYILRRRCARACALMEGTDDLSHIAFAAGFASQSHFTTAFRRLVGTTPAAWRRARRG